MRILTIESWKSLCMKHRSRVKDLLGGKYYDRNIHDRHPIYNFIFNYYRFRPHRTLELYSPGVGVALSSSSFHHLEKELYLPSDKYLSTLKENYIKIDPVKSLNESSIQRIKNILTLLEMVQNRKPSFSCFGVHEFAMLHSGARHSYYQKNLKLRMTQDQIDRVVERAPIACTHFDATRHFPKSASKRCKVKTSPKQRIENEQAGCVHTNLDLFKHSLRLWPFASSELVADALELAIHARELDMRASPYDLKSTPNLELNRKFDFTPVLIETESGRAEFRNATMQL